jgi:hypothetical protein
VADINLWKLFFLMLMVTAPIAFCWALDSRMERLEANAFLARWGLAPCAANSLPLTAMQRYGDALKARLNQLGESTEAADGGQWITGNLGTVFDPHQIAEDVVREVLHEYLRARVVQLMVGPPESEIKARSEIHDAMSRARSTLAFVQTL